MGQGREGEVMGKIKGFLRRKEGKGWKGREGREGWEGKRRGRGMASGREGILLQGLRVDRRP